MMSDNSIPSFLRWICRPGEIFLIRILHWVDLVHSEGFESHFRCKELTSISGDWIWLIGFLRSVNTPQTRSDGWGCSVFFFSLVNPWTLKMSVTWNATIWMETFYHPPLNLHSHFKLTCETWSCIDPLLLLSVLSSMLAFCFLLF